MQAYNLNRLKVLFQYGKRIKKSEMDQEILLLGKRILEIIKEKNLKTREVAHDANMDVENRRKCINARKMKISKAVYFKDFILLLLLPLLKIDQCYH